MPSYTHECPVHGEFTIVKTISEHKQYEPCEECGVPSAMVFKPGVKILDYTERPFKRMGAFDVGKYEHINERKHPTRRSFRQIYEGWERGWKDLEAEAKDEF